MKKTEFIKSYCEKSEMTKDELLKTQIVLPCNCDEKDCHGWAVVSNNNISIKTHNNIN